MQQFRSMSESDFRFGVLKQAAPHSVGYRLMKRINGQECSHPSTKSISLEPFRFPRCSIGLYFVIYYNGSERPIHRATVPVRWNGRDEPASTLVQDSSPADHADDEVPPLSTHLSLAGEGAFGLELENAGLQTSMKLADARFFGGTLQLYEGFQRVMGQHSAREFQVRNEQLDQLARSTKVMLDTQLDMMETIRQHAHHLQSPPPPPQWDKIVSVAIPAIQEMYCETVRGIRGAAKKGPRMQGASSTPKVGGLADQADEPTDAERVKRLYELIGVMGNEESMRAIRKDPDAFKQWSEAISEVLGTNGEE